MASASDIRDIRAATDEPGDDVYSDDDLSDMANMLGVTGAIHRIWEEKAARFSGLVNISEGGSSMSLGQLYQNAVSQAEHWRKIENEVSPATNPSGRPFVNRITRDVL
jgi:hypothetical protein